MKNKFVMLFLILASWCVPTEALATNFQLSIFNFQFPQNEDQKRAEYREQIGVDLSVPDYDVKKPDAKVMGWRLAKILQSMEQNYNQGVYSQMLMSIRAEQMEDNKLLYIPINKLKIKRITKSGDDIVIIVATTSKAENIGKVDFDLNLKFHQGVSDSDLVNSLFTNLGRYIKEDE